MRRWATTVLFCLWSVLLAASAAGQQVTLQGLVSDGATGGPLPGANIALQAVGDADADVRGAVTEQNGYYQITGIAAGAYAVRASFVGYVPFADTLDLGTEDVVTLSIRLVPGAEALDEVIVETEGGATEVDAGLQRVRPADLARIPTPDPSGDLAMYLQTMPGVVSVGDRGGQLFIRGGTPSQNLVLIDNMLVYQPFHIVGFFSAFPEDLVATADVYAGGFGARYSGRISSVIDVQMREGSKQRVQGAASVSPFLVSARLEGPLRKDEISLIGSVRRSVIERVGPGLLGETLPLRFGDAMLKLHGAPKDNSRYSVTALHTYDRGRIDPERSDDQFKWNNVVVSGRYLSFPTEVPILFEVNSGISYVQNAVGSTSRPERSSSALRVSSEVNLTRFIGASKVNGGFFARANWLSYTLGEQFQALRADTDLIISAGGYLEVDLALRQGLSLSPGLAVGAYPFTYGLTLEPRLRARWTPGGGALSPEFSGALGLYRQTVTGLRDERDAGSAFLAWVTSPFGRRQPRAFHALIGWQQPLASWLSFSAEGYYKRLTDLAVPIWSTIARFTTTLTPADGTVYGADVRVEVQRRPFYFYANYGYAWTEYEAAQDNFGLWFGEPTQRYHPPHDRRHQANVIFSLDFGLFQTSARWQFGSGLPYTRPLGFDELIRLRPLPDVREVYGTPRVLFEKPYQGRLPTYHRLDVSAERAFRLPGSTLTLQAGVINLYDRTNLFYFDIFNVRRVDQLPLIPNLSVKLETR